jgi:hypothetical protein
LFRKRRFPSAVLVLILAGCARRPSAANSASESLPVGQTYAWQIRAEHTDEILVAIGDSLDVVLLRDRCGVPAGHGQTGCYDASSVRVAPEWIFDDPGLSEVRALPEGRWYFGPGAAGARVYGRRPGTTTLGAVVANQRLASAWIRVVSAPGAVRVVLEPKPRVIAAGDTLRFRITARDSAGLIVATLPLPAGWNVVGQPDSLGFTPVAFYPWETGGRLVARLGRLTDTLELHFQPRHQR